MCSTDRIRRDRGAALAVVLIVLMVLFVLGVAVGGLSTNNARLVSTAQDNARARQAALAGQTLAQARLNAISSWASGELFPTTEQTLDDASDGRNSTYYTLQLEGSRQAQRVTVRTLGYLKNADGSHRAETTMVVRYQRSEGAFRYPVQAEGVVELSGTASVKTVDDVAVRTNSVQPNAVAVGGSATVEGDVIVGPTLVTDGIVQPATAASGVAAASASAVLQPVVVPSMAAGTFTRSTPAPGGTP